MKAPRRSTRDRVRGAAGGFWRPARGGGAGRLRKVSMMRQYAWPTAGEEIAVWATMHGFSVDVDWLGRTLRPEDYGLFLPETGHANPFRIWAAIESWAGQDLHAGTLRGGDRSDGDGSQERRGDRRRPGGRLGHDGRTVGGAGGTGGTNAPVLLFWTGEKVSDVEDLRAELNSIADAYNEIQDGIDRGASAADAIRQRWQNTKVEDRMISEEIEQFHRMYGSIGSWAFNISAQIAGRARRL
jgi:hypothetical protein